MRGAYFFRLLTVAFLIALVPRALTVAGDKPTAPEKARQAFAFHVVGYLPDYRVAAIDPEVGRLVTDLIFFSVQPERSGELNLKHVNPEHLAKLKKIKEQYSVRLSLCIGGWQRSRNFAVVASAPASRQRFARAVTRFCVESGFDGADLDWEHPANETEEQNYAALLAEVKRAFTAHKFQLTAAMAGWQNLPAEGFKALDRIHLMAYDAEGRHSTFAFAESEIARMVKRGVSATKICLGVPFYGKAVANTGKAFSYAELLRDHQLTADVDEVDGIYFNGIKTIARKTRYALDNSLSGIMIWELGQDSKDDRSLLRAIHEVVKSAKTR